MGYGPVKTHCDDIEKLTTSTKPEIISSEIYALEAITEKLEDLINRISGARPDDSGEQICPAPPAYCLTEILTFGVDRIADTRRKALEQIETIHNMLF
jgi:hypothetical protein